MKLYELNDEVNIEGLWIVSHWDGDVEDFRKYLDDMDDDEVDEYADMEIVRICPISNAYGTPVILVEVM